MKIIKASIDLETWFLENECKGCKSIIGIESKDIWYNYNFEGSCWYYTCELCDSQISILEKSIPKIVQADVLKNRKIINYARD